MEIYKPRQEKELLLFKLRRAAECSPPVAKFTKQYATWGKKGKRQKRYG